MKVYIAKLLKCMWSIGLKIQIPGILLWQLWHGLRVDPSWRFSGRPLLYMAGGNNPLTRLVICHALGRASRVVIGRRFSALSTSRYNSLGVIQKTLLRTCAYGAELIIGDDVGVSGVSICAAKAVRIGNNVLIGTGTIITDSDLHPADPAMRLSGKEADSMPVTIEDNVFIGARAIILKGVTIGEGSTIGAGSVVTRDIPSYCVAVGNPAMVVKRLR